MILMDVFPPSKDLNWRLQNRISQQDQLVFKQNQVKLNNIPENILLKLEMLVSSKLPLWVCPGTTALI